MFRKIATVGIVALLLFSLMGLTACSKSSNKFSEAEHIQRVTERIEKRFVKNSAEITGVEVFPLYDINDELKYFLAEFEPYGFLYVRITPSHSIFLSWFGGVGSMYSLSHTTILTDWSRYTYDEEQGQPFPDGDKIWETDINGNRIIYKKSPYYVAGIKNEKRYLLRSIPAIKSGNGYINLISMTAVVFDNGQISEKQATGNVSFIYKGSLDL